MMREALDSPSAAVAQEVNASAVASDSVRAPVSEHGSAVGDSSVQGGDRDVATGGLQGSGVLQPELGRKKFFLFA